MGSPLLLLGDTFGHRAPFVPFRLGPWLSLAVLLEQILNLLLLGLLSLALILFFPFYSLMLQSLILSG